MAFENFPYSDLHNLNLDWIMEQVGKLADIDYQGLLDHNIELSTNHTTTDPDTMQKESRGSLPASYISDVNDYYLSLCHLIAKKDDTFLASLERRLFGIRTADQKILIPYANGNQMTSAGDPMGALLCMASFVNTGMTYGRLYGMFNTDPAQVDFHQLVCSDYVACGLRGIDFRNSKYGGARKNFESIYKSRTWPNDVSLTAPVEKDTLITREMAYIFAGRDALWELDYKEYSNVQPGDVLFFAYYSDSNEAKNNYLSIHHCAAVLDVDKYGHRITVLESGEPSNVLFDYCYNRYSDVPSEYSADIPAWDAATTYVANDKVRYANSFGRDCVWIAKIGSTGQTPTENSDYWASLGTGPNVDSLNISHRNMVSYRHVYVARPAYPQVHCVPLISETVNDVTDYNTGGSYMSLHQFPASYWNFKKGDIICLKMKSDLGNQIDDGTNTSTTLRIAGVTSGGIYNTLWHSVTNNTWHDIPNDRVIYFLVDQDYTRINLMLKSSVEAEITTELTMDVYRL